MGFVDLHVHTKFTAGNATTTVKELVQRAKQYNMKSLAITDSASVAGFGVFAEECAREGIKPIFGCGFYFTPGSRFDHSDEKYHIVLLAEDNYGFANLLRMVALSYEEGFYKCPRIDFQVLQEHSRGLICLTGGLGGLVDKPILEKRRKDATWWLKKLKTLFSTNHLFLEIQRNGVAESATVEKAFKTMTEKHSLKEIATGGSFYLDKSDADRCNRLRRRYKNKKLEGDGFNFCSPEEMLDMFSDKPEALSISEEIAERCNVTEDFTEYKNVSRDPRERLYGMMSFFGIEALAHP